MLIWARGQQVVVPSVSFTVVLEPDLVRTCRKEIPFGPSTCSADQHFAVML